MADFGSALWNKPASGGGGGGGDSTPAADPVTRSLRFDDGSSPYLVRAASDIGSPTDAKKVTVAFWFKLGNIVASRRALVANTNSAGTDFWWMELDASHRLNFMVNNNSSSVQGQYITNRVFRDPSAWTHICVSCDSTASEAADRAIIYINGVRETSFSTTNHWPANWLNEFNEGTYSQYISSYIGTSMFFDGYIADVYNIDGQQLEPTEFIESNNGSYKPKEYTGTYGNNGWHIDMQPQHDADLLVTSVGRNDGDTTFADAAQGHGLTVSGDTEHSIAVGNPFTGDDRMMYLNGDYLSMPHSSDWTIGSGDATIEFWIKTSDSTGDILYNTSSTSPYAGWLISIGFAASGKISFFNASSSNNEWKTMSNSISDGLLHHVAVVKDGTSLKFYLDGNLDSSHTLSHTGVASNVPLLVGKQAGTTNRNLQGHLYDIRIVNGTAVYSGEFTPPSGKLTTTGGTYPSTTNVDTSITSSHTVLLIPPEKDDTDFHDESDSGHTVTTYGTPTRKASSPYEAAAKSTAMYFDGSGDEIVAWVDGTSGDYDFGTADYTIECWAYIDSSDSAVGTYNTLWASALYKNQCFEYAGDLLYYTHLSGGSSPATRVDFPLGQWNHVAVVRDSGTMRIYVNGKFGFSYSQSGDAGGGMTIGGGITGYPAYSMDGHIYDFRVTGGEAKYSGTSTASDWANFDEITAPFELNPVYLGGDQSGNKNHFTATNISGHDAVLDTPTRNYATLNPVSDVVASGSNTFSNGNLTLSLSHADNKAASTIAVSSGKWYAEVRYDSAGHQMAGIGRVDCLENTTNYIGENSSAFGYVIYRPNGDMYHNGSTTDIFSNLSSGDILQIALDLDSNTVWWGLNGTWVGTVGSSGGTSITAAEYYFVQTYRDSCTWNFGQDPTFAGNKTSGQDTTQDEFYYAPPTGFSGL